MRIYIAGPYNDKAPKAVIQANVDAADEAARMLVSLGHDVFCPHKMTHHWEDDVNLHLDDFMRLDASFIHHWAEAVLRLPGRSVGAEVEVALAEAHGLPVFYDIAEIPGFQPYQYGLPPRVWREVDSNVYTP